MTPTDNLHNRFIQLLVQIRDARDPAQAQRRACYGFGYIDSQFEMGQITQDQLASWVKQIEDCRDEFVAYFGRRDLPRYEDGDRSDAPRRDPERR